MSSENRFCMFMRKKYKEEICKRESIKLICFLVIGVYLFLLVQKVLMPEWNWPQISENTSWQIESFKNLDDNSLDVVFCGTSHMQYGISPMEIYKDYGIVSYNLATSGQPLDMTYFMLEEMFKTQSPSFVVLDASSFYFSKIEPGDASRRYCLDSLPFSKEKVKAAKEYSELSNGLSEKDKVERFISVIFPIVTYHTNWKTIVKGNFEFEPKSNYCTAGGVISPYKAGAYTDIKGVDYMVEMMLQDHVQRTIFRNATGEIDTIEADSVIYSPEIIDAQRENINRINELCKNNNSQLIVIKTPVLGFPYRYGSSWSKVKYEQTKALSEEIGVAFFDMNYEADIVDLANDFLDTGYHLNYNGTVKASKCMGEYLVSLYGLGGNKSAYMDANIDSYNKLTDLVKLEMETDFLNYSQLLKQNAEDYIIIITAKEYWKAALTENDIAALNTIGLYSDIQDYLDVGNSYVALIDGGIVEHEEISNRIITYDYAFDAKNSIKLVSAGAIVGNLGEIYVNDTQVAMSGRGLNIVVLDKETYKLIDSCYVDTNIESGHNLIRTGNLFNNIYDVLYGEN